MSSSRGKDKRSKETTWSKAELSRELKKHEKAAIAGNSRRRNDGDRSTVPGKVEPRSSSKASATVKHASTHSPKPVTKSIPATTSAAAAKQLKDSSSHKSPSTNSPVIRRHHQQLKREDKRPHPLSDEEGIKELPIIPMEEIISEEIPSAHLMGGGDIDEYLNEEFEEDYEEDFEEFSDHSDEKSLPLSPSSDIDDILEAIGQENQLIDDKTILNVISPSAPPPPSHLSPRPTMSFSILSQQQQQRETSHRIMSRAIELSSMIERETLSISLLELQPLTEYGLYMRNYGQANTSQVGTQTGQDLIEEETQTEPITSTDHWTQWPPHDMRGYGTSGVDEEDMFVEYDSEKLLKFLQKASQVCDTLLEEEEEHQLSGVSTVNSKEDQYCQLMSSLNINGTAVQCINWNHTHSDMLLVGCVPQEGVWHGLLEVWQLSRTVHPQHCLGGHSVPISCCSWYPLIFAGNEDGTILVWDLRESLLLHKKNQTQSSHKLVRTPTYTTAANTDQYGHCQPVIHVETSGVHYKNTEWNSQGLSFQLLSLDASGCVCVWVVIELPEGDASGSPVDLGLAPGGRVKLIASAVLNILLAAAGPVIATCLTVSRADINTLLIGTDSGNVIRHVRYRPRAVPKHYQLMTDSICAEVTSISSHPHLTSHFLVTYSSGHMALFHLRWPHPLITWPPPPQTDNQVISDINWHFNLPSVFVCCRGDRDVLIWDLLTTDSQPVHVLKIAKDVSSLRLMSSDQQSSVLAIASNQEVLLYNINTAHLEHNPNHLELFENYLMTLK